SPQGRTSAGAVRVFAGGPLAQNAPATFISAQKAEGNYLGVSPYVYFGFQVATGDATGDGQPDLVVGEWIANMAVPQAGAIHVFAGVKGALPALAPSRSIGGKQ